MDAGPEDFLGLGTVRDAEPLWVVIDDVDEPKAQWSYYITKTNPSNMTEWARLGSGQKIQVDTQPRQYSYGAICEDLGALGVSLSHMPKEAYFLPTEEEKQERVGRIVRTVHS
jgi:hypothetical protein